MLVVLERKFLQKESKNLTPASFREKIAYKLVTIARGSLKREAEWTNASINVAFTFIAESRISGCHEYSYGAGGPPLFVPRDICNQHFQSI